MIYKDIIYIHIPKTGGSSIRNSLNENYKLIFNSTEKNLKEMGFNDLNEKFENYNFSIKYFRDHLPYQLIKKKKFEINKYKFTIIRNPFSRLVSLYFECISNKFHLDNLGLDKSISFEAFVNQITNKSYWFTIPMLDYLGEKNIKEIDYIGRFENFDDDIFKLKKRFKIIIKHHNYNNYLKSKFKFNDYRSFYKNEKIINKVLDYYQKDFKQFGYNFDDFLIFKKNKINILNILSKNIKRKIKNLF